LLVAGAATAGLLLVALAVAARATRTADRAILDASQQFASLPLDFLSSLLSAVGGLVVTSAVALALAGLFFKRQGVLAATPLLMFAGVGVEFVLKRLIDHPAPPLELLRDAHWLAIGGLGDGGNAFPSGHLSRTTFLSLVVASRWPKLRWPAVALTALMGASRIYSGSHWASDVVGGVFLGVALAGVASAIDAQRRRGVEVR
jgi:undecaprenyl-diphosphatase